MLSKFKKLTLTAFLNFIGIIAAPSAVIALSYTDILPDFYLPLLLLILFATSLFSINIMLSAETISFLKKIIIALTAIIIGSVVCFLIFAVESLFWPLNDLILIISSGITALLLMILGGFMFVTKEKRSSIYIASILWQSCLGIWIATLTAYFFWSWVWLI